MSLQSLKIYIGKLVITSLYKMLKIVCLEISTHIPSFKLCRYFNVTLATIIL